MQKIISWNICKICNYSCIYCSGGRHHDHQPDKKTVSHIARRLADLPGNWEIKISGGEPFCCRSLISAVKILVSTGHLISIVTNLSASERQLKRFLRVSGSNLRTISVSLHREHVEWMQFLEKVSKLKKQLQRLPGTSLVINCVVEQQQIEELLLIRDECQRRDLRFYPQLLKIKGKVVDYTQSEKTLIRKLTSGNDPFSINRAPSMLGATCYAGMYYAVVSDTGEAFSCYPSKRDGSGLLGNLAEETFNLRTNPISCPFDACPCSVPLNRGIVIQKIAADKI